MNIKPLHDHLLVNRDAPDTHNGIIEIPQENRRPKNWGTVTAVGPAVPPSLRPGTRVVFGAYAGAEIPGPTGDLTLLTFPEILAIIEETPAEQAAHTFATETSPEQLCDECDATLADDGSVRHTTACSLHPNNAI